DRGPRVRRPVVRAALRLRTRLGRRRRVHDLRRAVHLSRRATARHGLARRVHRPDLARRAAPAALPRARGHRLRLQRGTVGRGRARGGPRDQRVTRTETWAVIGVLLVTSFLSLGRDVWTPDEPREVEIGREMWLAPKVVPTLNDERFIEKP